MVMASSHRCRIKVLNKILKSALILKKLSLLTKCVIKGYMVPYLKVVFIN